MNNSALNFTSPESSTNSTTHSIRLVQSLDICMYIINFLIGVPTHSYMLWLIVTGTGSGVAAEIFNLNLSVCEIGNSLNSLFCILMFIWFSHLSTLAEFLRGLSITGQPLFQCLICVECYLAVVHPVTFLKYKPLRYRVICCTVVWIITLGSCFCCMCTTDLTYIFVWFFSLQYLFFFSIQMFCLVAVLGTLKQSGPGERAREREREEENHMKRKAFYLILITTVTMVIIYVPFTISGLSFILTEHYIEELFSFGLICNVLACFVQPVLYLYRVGKCSWLENLPNRCMIH